MKEGKVYVLAGDVGLQDSISTIYNFALPISRVTEAIQNAFNKDQSIEIIIRRSIPNPMSNENKVKKQ